MAARVDWFRVIVELERAGYPIALISAETSIPWETLRHWRNRGGSPRWETGDAVIKLWRRVTDRHDADPPLEGGQTLSVARAKG